MPKKLIEQLRWLAAECDRTNFGCQARKLLIEAADELEKTEPKRGRWIWDDRYSDYFCSECNHYDLRIPDFCGKCGADMREEKSSNA